VGDLEAAALACNLQQLQHLELIQCDLGSMVCLAAIAKLTQLTALHLHNDFESGFITRRGLMLLTGLSRLQRLDVGWDGEVTDEVLQQFWAALRKQQQT
jgi:hypothetical protein